MSTLVKRRFIGIPFVDEFPVGKIGDMARSIVVVPQTGLVIQDQVLAKILGENTGRLNQFAMRSGVESAQISQPIEIICDSSIQDNISTDSKSGPVAKGYELDQAIKLLRDREADIENLQAAFKWFWETVDTNPYRRKSQALAQEISVLLAKIQGCKQKAGEASSRHAYLPGRGRSRYFNLVSLIFSISQISPTYLWKYSLIIFRSIAEKVNKFSLHSLINL